jgi:hypothetical protein
MRACDHRHFDGSSDQGFSPKFLTVGWRVQLNSILCARMD